MQTLYFDGFEPGQILDSKGVTLSESQILDIALLMVADTFAVYGRKDKQKDRDEE